ncbi:MAG: hypothetical protein HY057_06080 [Rhodospirillales bacterium]|nr:hypothetical protein [Rhodospirillales bacterium]
MSKTVADLSVTSVESGLAAGGMTAGQIGPALAQVNEVLRGIDDLAHHDNFTAIDALLAAASAAGSGTSFAEAAGKAAELARQRRAALGEIGAAVRALSGS